MESSSMIAHPTIYRGYLLGQLTETIAHITQSGIIEMVHPRYFLCLLTLGVALAACQPTNRAKPVVTGADASKIKADQKPASEASPIPAAQPDNETTIDEPDTDNGVPAPTLPATDATAPDVALNEPVNDDTEPVSIDEDPAEEAISIPIKPPAGPRQLYPQFMLGKLVDDLRDSFGDPSVVRVEGEVKVWQYRGEQCVLDFYLYPENDRYIVTHWHWRHPIVGQNIDPLSCRIELADHL